MVAPDIAFGNTWYVSAEWIGTPQLSMLCYSPRVPIEQFSLFTHMKDVLYPIIWYYPLDHRLGDWKYEYGDTLICQLWECDGAPNGCHPDKPNILPNAKAGDDLIGQATLSMGSYQILASHLLNMTIPRNGKGNFGDPSASFLIECKGCKELWSKDPSWYNPFTERPPPMEPSPSPSPPPNEQVDVPPVSPSPSETQSPLPWRDPEDKKKDEPDTKDEIVETDENVEPFEGPVIPTKLDEPNDPTSAPPSPDTTNTPEQQKGEESESSSGGGSNILVIVLAALGALVGVLVLAGITYMVLKRCGWRRVEPIEEPKPTEKDENVARHLRIRVQRPAEADAAIRQHQADGALAELPWAPKTKH